MSGAVHSVNVSPEGGVPKIPVSSANIMKGGLEGDFNRFRAERRDDDASRAVSLFSLERIRGLKTEGHPIEVGSTGENITIEGIEWDAMTVGTRLRIGESLLELSEPCAPCSKIGDSFIDRRFSRVDQEVASGWSRWLARVIEEGEVETGDPVNIVL